MSCVTCGAPGHDTDGRYLCVRHGGVPSAAFLAALVGEGETTTRPAPEVAPEETAEHEDEILQDRPPAAMRAYTWLFLAVTAVHAVLLVVDVLVLRREDKALRQYAVEQDYLQATSAQAVFALVDRVGAAVSVALWVTLLMFAVWFGLAGRVVDRMGRDRRTVLRHWTYLGWRLALVPLVVYLFAEAARDEMRPAERFAFVEEALSVNHTAIMFVSLRIVMLAMLAGFVVVVWRRLSPQKPDALPF
ncbi:hypothetical protein [Dactylosporangium sp. CA-233914]|uniref:hypothetical protein n=1 Tax=Dactylosporangium sp. CA-233914 TaxID=3239934 RepID=UPI003D8E3ED5